MNEPTLKIKKVKLNKDSTLQIHYDEIIEGEAAGVNKLVIDSTFKAHEDLVNSLSALRKHLMLICEQAKTETSSVINSIKVTGYVIGGEDEESEGVTLIGQRTLTGNKILNLVSPFTKFNDESSDYKSLSDLVGDVGMVEAEALEFLRGKHAPDAQLEMEFDGPTSEEN